jgi:hypothetical protein
MSVLDTLNECVRHTASGRIRGAARQGTRAGGGAGAAPGRGATSPGRFSAGYSAGSMGGTWKKRPFMAHDTARIFSSPAADSGPTATAMACRSGRDAAISRRVLTSPGESESSPSETTKTNSRNGTHACPRHDPAAVALPAGCCALARRSVSSSTRMVLAMADTSLSSDAPIDAAATKRRISRRFSGVAGTRLLSKHCDIVAESSMRTTFTQSAGRRVESRVSTTVTPIVKRSNECIELDRSSSSTTRFGVCVASRYHGSRRLSPSPPSYVAGNCRVRPVEDTKRCQRSQV